MHVTHLVQKRTKLVMASTQNSGMAAKSIGTCLGRGRDMLIGQKWGNSENMIGMTL